jgi:hypothetical protein
MLVSEIKEKYYKELSNTNFTHLCSGDPTSVFKEGQLVKVGRYVKWLNNLYKGGKLKLEDMEKSREYLQTIYNNRNKISVNVFNYDSLTDGENPIFNLVQNFIKPNGLKNELDLINNKYFISNGEAKVHYEDDKWLVIIPLTIGASEFYANGTQWCTRYPDQFNSYTKRGQLYIFINKEILNSDDPYRRYQYHIEDNQFMNLRDSSNREECVEKLAYQVLNKEISRIWGGISFKIYKNFVIGNKGVSFLTTQDYVMGRENPDKLDLNFEDNYLFLSKKYNTNSEWKKIFEESIQEYLKDHSVEDLLDDKFKNGNNIYLKRILNLPFLNLPLDSNGKLNPKLREWLVPIFGSKNDLEFYFKKIPYQYLEDIELCEESYRETIYEMNNNDSYFLDLFKRYPQWIFDGMIRRLINYLGFDRYSSINNKVKIENKIKEFNFSKSDEELVLKKINIYLFEQDVNELSYIQQGFNTKVEKIDKEISSFLDRWDFKIVEDFLKILNTDYNSERSLFSIFILVDLLEWQHKDKADELAELINKKYPTYNQLRMNSPTIRNRFLFGGIGKSYFLFRHLVLGQEFRF